MTTRRHQLIARRKFQGLSQETLAEHVGVTPNTTYRWERGESEPSATQRRPLAEALDVSLARLDRMLKNEDGEDTDGDLGPLVPAWLSAYVAMEQAAGRVEAYQPTSFTALFRHMTTPMRFCGAAAMSTGAPNELNVSSSGAWLDARRWCGKKIPWSCARFGGDRAADQGRRSVERCAISWTMWPIWRSGRMSSCGSCRSTVGPFTNRAGTSPCWRSPGTARRGPSTLFTETEPARRHSPRRLMRSTCSPPNSTAYALAALGPTESIEFIRRLAKEHHDV